MDCHGLRLPVNTDIKKGRFLWQKAALITVTHIYYLQSDSLHILVETSFCKAEPE